MCKLKSDLDTCLHNHKNDYKLISENKLDHHQSRSRSWTAAHAGEKQYVFIQEWIPYRSQLLTT